jgi:hypothetical protein
MTYYPPTFVPLHFHSGPMSGKDALISLVVVLTVAFGILDHLGSPKLQMNVTQNRDNYSADVSIRTRNSPQIISVNNKNIECLKQKGYIVNDTDNKYYGGSWNRIVYVETGSKELPNEKLINDCKECNVHTEIIYKYDNIFWNEKQDKKTLYWHKCYTDQLK